VLEAEDPHPANDSTTALTPSSADNTGAGDDRRRAGDFAFLLVEGTPEPDAH
jgi:hypothetical protein